LGESIPPFEATAAPSSTDTKRAPSTHPKERQ
jgi:hypothetical protein